MRRQMILIAGGLLATASMTTPALAMQPPGGPAQANFGCVDGQDDPVNGHPGAPGIADAARLVAELTGDPTPTAWNAVEHADPIDFGSC